MKGLHRGADRASALLEREAVTGAHRAVPEPADRGVEFTGEDRHHRVVVATDEDVTATDVDVIGQLDRDRQRCDGNRAIPVEGVDHVDRVPAGRLTIESPTCRVPPERRPV